jgi:hypothetical protein
VRHSPGLFFPERRLFALHYIERLLALELGSDMMACMRAWPLDCLKRDEIIEQCKYYILATSLDFDYGTCLVFSLTGKCQPGPGAALRLNSHFFSRKGLLRSFLTLITRYPNHHPYPYLKDYLTLLLLQVLVWSIARFGTWILGNLTSHNAHHFPRHNSWLTQSCKIYRPRGGYFDCLILCIEDPLAIGGMQQLSLSTAYVCEPF